MSRNDVRQIAVYADHEFFRKVEKEAADRHRRIGPTVLEILREYFNKKENNVRNSTRKAG